MTLFEGPGARRLRARRLRRLLLILGALAIALVVVALLPQDRHSGSLTVATATRSEGKATGVVQGVLRGARSGNRVCFTVDALQGHVLLVLPPGWSADAALRLLDRYGQTRAKAGASTSFLGAPGAVGTVPGCSAPGRLWYTTDVRRPVGGGASS